MYIPFFVSPSSLFLRLPSLSLTLSLSLPLLFLPCYSPPLSTPALFSLHFYSLSSLSPTFSLSPSLLGPRRKLSIAIAELKEKEEKPQRGVSSLPSSINRGPGRGGEGEDGVDGGGGYSKSSERGKGRGRGSRPQLYKQPSTELQAAYHQVRVILHSHCS